MRQLSSRYSLMIVVTQGFVILSIDDSIIGRPRPFASHCCVACLLSFDAPSFSFLAVYGNLADAICLPSLNCSALYQSYDYSMVRPLHITCLRAHRGLIFLHLVLSFTPLGLPLLIYFRFRCDGLSGGTPQTIGWWLMVGVAANADDMPPRRRGEIPNPAAAEEDGECPGARCPMCRCVETSAARRLPPRCEFRTRHPRVCPGSMPCCLVRLKGCTYFICSSWRRPT